MELEERDLVMLEALQRHEGWAAYLKLLDDYQETIGKTIRRRLVTPDDYALHNENIGRLNAVEKCKKVITDVLNVAKTKK